jgi:predicted nucleic acid-binding protein
VIRAGRWRATARDHGLALSLADALVAAAAESLEAVIVTRNVRDFRLTPVSVETY